MAIQTRNLATTGFRLLKSLLLLSLLVPSLVIIALLNVPESSADVQCDCGFCHGENHHGDNWAGCSGCHDAPPQTGTHLVHYNSPPLGYAKYGDTTITSTDDAYQFGCGNCHPLDHAKHNNGTVNVELYDPAAPSGSLKSLNPPTAQYVPGANVTVYASKLAGAPPFSWSDGRCSDVYCHSGPSVSSGPVGQPLVDSLGHPIRDENGNLTYDPYTVNNSRTYKTTPSWGTSGTFTTCTECHQFPLTTYFPSVQAGVGDSHQWVDDYGYGNLHGWNMGFEPIGCRTCHYGTITQTNTSSRDTNSDVTTYNPVALASLRYHVNGVKDVIFDMTDPVIYATSDGPATLGLSAATYDQNTKTCSNVACHLNQTKVTWGTPYRWWNTAECDLCHRRTHTSR
jgi:predicted CxxxxCH...CXXCH cytochrome family protein